MPVRPARGYASRSAVTENLPDAAICVVVDGAGRVLTVSRPEPPHELSIPGGLVDPGESHAEAAVRELVEECGVTVHAIERATTVRSPTDGRRVYVFRAGSHSGRARAAEPQTRVAWLAPEELLAQARLYRSTVRELMADGLLESPDSATWYHGSPHRFDRFQSRVGHTFGTGASDVPLFLTRDPKFAALYAGPSGTIYEVKPHVDRTFDARQFVLDERYWPPPRDALSPEGQRLYDDLVENRIFPEMIRYGTKHEDEDEWRSMHDSQGAYASIFVRNYDVMETTEMKRWLRAHDYDSFFVSGDGPDNNIAVFDPGQIEILSTQPALEILENEGRHDHKLVRSAKRSDVHGAHRQERSPGLVRLARHR